MGAKVISINTGNGKINEFVGSEYPSVLSDEVKLHSADFGIAPMEMGIESFSVIHRKVEL